MFSAYAVSTVRSEAAPATINIGGLYPATGSFAPFRQDPVNGGRLAVQMVNNSDGIELLGGAKLNLIVSNVQRDTS